MSIAFQKSGVRIWYATSFSPDTKLGGQMDVKFNSDFSATVQAVTLHQFDNSFDPELMLAFGKWQATPSVALRAGRLALPMFTTSDYRLVSYSQPWVRPPVEMYHSVGGYSYDGVDANWSTLVGDVAVKSQAFYGSLELPRAGMDVKVDRFMGANVTAESGASSYRLSYVSSGGFSFSSPAIDGLFQMVRSGLPADALGPGSPALAPSPALADEYELRNRKITYTTIGFNHDPGDWFFTGEASKSTSVGFLPAGTSAYATVGVRRSNLTPYGTLSMAKAKVTDPTGNPLIDALVQSSAALGRKALGVGLRWDARKDTAVKVQLDHTNLDEGSSGVLANLQPGFQPGSSYNVLSATLDFVF
jgi:hypothetical protein